MRLPMTTVPARVAREHNRLRIPHSTSRRISRAGASWERLTSASRSGYDPRLDLCHRRAPGGRRARGEGFRQCPRDNRGSSGSLESPSESEDSSRATHGREARPSSQPDHPVIFPYTAAAVFHTPHRGARPNSRIMTLIDVSKPDPTALESWDRPVERLRCEAYCLGRTLMPDSETLERTAATLILFGVWAAIVLGPMFANADPPRWELQIGITALAFSILGRMWDLEVQRLLNGITISTDGGQPRDRDDRED